MATLFFITGFALLIMETLVGMVANGFIVLISLIDWFRSRKLSPTDLILSCLGLSRLFLQAIILFHVTMIAFFYRTYIYTSRPSIHLIIMTIWFFTEAVDLWFAACLGVWYLTKIAIFSHPIFLRVKQGFSGLVRWLLLGSVAFCAFMTIIIFARQLSGLPICDPYKLLLNNSSDSEVKNPRHCMDLVITVIVANVIPSVIFLSSTILLIMSLWKHIRHLQHNGTGVRDLNTNVHLSAIKALASFAILYISSFVLLNLQSIPSSGNYSDSWSSILLQNVRGLYPSGHAVILILINPKLKKAWVSMIHHLKCHVSEPRS